MELTEERVRALARSSPWRWDTLRFTLVGPGTRIRDLLAVDHHGRLAWQAVLEPTDAYEPPMPDELFPPTPCPDGRFFARSRPR